jgi:UrcA family protein
MTRNIMLLVVAAGMASPAIAAPADSDATRQIVVRYADLDLSTPAGEAALQRRIHAAVNAVCPYEFGDKELRARIMRMQCMAEATLRTTPRVNQVVADARAAHQSSANQLVAR